MVNEMANKQLHNPWVWFKGEDYIWVNSSEVLDGLMKYYSCAFACQTNRGIKL